MTAPLHALRRAALQTAGVIGPAAPVRIVHLGLGAFHRAHQAWYTATADESGEWGIAAFTGRDATQAELLDSQDGLYTLVERGPDGDRVQLIASIVQAVPGSDLGRLFTLLADPAVALVTMTITESGYRLDAEGRADLSDAVTAGDLDRLATAGAGKAALTERLVAAAPAAALTRLLSALIVRHAAGAPPIALVPCDNLPRNGSALRGALVELAAALPDTVATPAFRRWLADSVSFVSTSVDRITPRTTPDAAAAATAAGWADRATVVTEPFSDWVLSGEFPAGRPAWEGAGARFVADIDGWEHRKLWLLNGAHTILAAAGLLRGHATVAQAVGDPECLALVEAFWAEAVEELPADIEHVHYRAQLLARFRNARIEHQLRQIATDGTTKVRLRIAEIAERRVAEGRSASGCQRALETWVEWVIEDGDAPDARRAELDRALAEPDPRAALLNLFGQSVAKSSEP